MERQPHPITDRGEPYVPLSIYETDCGGIQCEANPFIACPDTHHLYGKGRGAVAEVRRLCLESTVQLKRCQHNELHARYEPPELPTREQAIEIRSRNGNT